MSLPADDRDDEGHSPPDEDDDEAADLAELRRLDALLPPGWDERDPLTVDEDGLLLPGYLAADDDDDDDDNDD